MRILFFLSGYSAFDVFGCLVGRQMFPSLELYQNYISLIKPP